MNFPLLFKLSYLNSYFALTLGYLNPALNNPALFRIGNSAGWQDIYFHRLRLGITNISSSAGWNRRKYRETGQETGTIYRHQLSQGDLHCPRLIAVTGKAGLNWFEQLLLARAPKSSCNVP